MSSGRSQARAINRQTAQMEANAARQERQMRENARMQQMQLEQQQQRERLMREISDRERNQLQQTVQVDVAPTERDTATTDSRRRRPIRERFRMASAASGASGLNI